MIKMCHRNTRSLGSHLGMPGIGRFVLLEVIGEGKHTVVAKVLDRGHARVCVVKTYLTGRGYSAKEFHARECAALEALSPHPNIIKHYGSHEDCGGLHVILEHFGGITLQRAVFQAGSSKEGWGQMAWCLKQILQGLKHMHKNGVYHCDLKPENILLLDGAVKVIDFGCSIISTDGVGSGKDVALLGTPGFGPTETADMAYDGPVNLKDMDIWAFGCIMYYVYTGVVPFVSLFPFDTLRNVRDVRIDLSVVPSAVESILRRTFASDPLYRYTIEELAQAVDALET